MRNARMIICLMVVGVILYVSNKAYSYSWTTEAISEVSGYFVSLAVDSGGDPFVAHRNPQANYELKLAIKKNDSWNLLTVDDTNPGEGLALSLNNQGMPRIAYEGGGDFKFASWNGWAWDLETVKDVQSPRSFSIVVDDADVSYVSYKNSPLGQLTYASNNNGSWNTEAIDHILGCTSIVLDQYNQPMIAYNDLGALKYAQKNTNDWDIQTIEAGHFWNSENISMVLNSAGLPHIAYCQDSKLKYAYFNGETWVKEVIYEDSLSISPSLVLDPQDNAYISFYDDDFDKVMFASLISSSWEIEPVFASHSSSETNTSIALDDFGYIHIAHSGNELMYATAYIPAIIPEPATLLLLGLGGLALSIRRR